jgi:hypothetical protein
LNKQNPIYDKNVFKLIIEKSGGTRFERRGCSWHMVKTMSFKKIVGIMGWKVLIV